MRSSLFIVLTLLLFSTLHSYGQATSLNLVPLNDLSAFSETTPNWHIVGDVTAEIGERHSIHTESGSGILVNLQTEDARGHLFSSWSHSDMELDLEVLMPSESNSGIYFQSRYEIQLFDSWGVNPPRHSDIGGIYQRWDESRAEGERGYEGHAPRVNVARAPGLWQHLNVLFKAPRFDDAGNKIQNARFERVTLNGVVIHENVEVTGPTRAAAYEDEVPEAPLMIQGDHGPVAFRNISYRLFSPESVQLSNLRLAYYQGEFASQMPDLASMEKASDGPVNAITSTDARDERHFAMQYSGSITVPETGNYLFEVTHSSRVRLEINRREVLTDQSEQVNTPLEFTRNIGEVYLTRGTYSFTLTYARGRWHSSPIALGWFVSGPGLMRTELTARGSVPVDPYSAFEMQPKNEPLMQRNFVIHGEAKRTHAISVGYPSGINYSYDLSRGALLHVWKGPFIDTSTMWFQRGNMQSALPLGSLIERSGLPAVAKLSNADSTWPDSLETFNFLRYEINDTGDPAFIYKIGDLEVRDTIVPDEDQRMLIRTILVNGSTDNAWLLLEESSSIKQHNDASYLIDDQRMYVQIMEGSGAEIRSTDKGQQLLIPLSSQNEIKYSLIW